MAKVRAHHLRAMKENGEKITMLTAYDAITAHIFDEAGIDMLLVGDSYGTTMLGHKSTVPVTMEQMELAVSAVARGVERAFIVGDMPFGSYEASNEDAVRNAVRLIKAGANAVKLEGGERMADRITAITKAGILVVGHIGYTPQSENALGGPRVQGRGDAALAILNDAQAVEDAGAIAVVLEMVPYDIAHEVTEKLNIPTIGIGAGKLTDGQVLVWSDMAGMQEWTPKFVKVFGEVGAALREATVAYKDAVKNLEFPDRAHAFDH
ncbi:3-methyl-2-oxobutanoate hydroxymethyltransferase [Arcanobacterium wilhelmae]|uniref:3-methyl-2-oxobutanoate hydroxymethyltransferase n=1 Tax=Arcanobacterium wilhelmae TaxID=1803177 RepID=A0ABT9N920_9ACTO|nr:3-methyl-2-oxobutanoate hydroxymethyltransferase [Arcanobacterium wilhelmae]MDP9800195.1 3-methyl-2-oxobutanoate hydroxymethyltransferase [Arcanobacterium wilhelmae]WFN89636.1 3-methyl-2-oxobutanoate hydroxymethyltransferase [Arcanobacterium wilhelmae]